MDVEVRDFFTRPARVLMADRFAQALVGGVEQVVDSVDVLTLLARYRQLGALYPGI